MRGSLGIEASASFPTPITKHILLYRIELIIIKHMKYRVDAYMNKGAVKQGAKLMDKIDDAIVLAKKVASYYHCQTRIARVAG